MNSSQRVLEVKKYSRSRSERQHRILQAARDVLLEHTENGLTLDLVCKKADVAKGSIYKHFSSKSELYFYLLIEREQEIASYIEELKSQIAQGNCKKDEFLHKLIERRVTDSELEFELGKIEDVALVSLKKKKCSAQSKALLDGARLKNVKAIVKYLNSVNSEREDLEYYQIFLLSVITKGLTSTINERKTRSTVDDFTEETDIYELTTKVINQVFSDSRTSPSTTLTPAIPT